jgi:hypothetical protein
MDAPWLKTSQTESANASERQRQASEPADPGERLRMDPDAP